MNASHLLTILWLSILAVANIPKLLQLHLESIQHPHGIIPISNSNLSLISQPNRAHFTIILLTSTDAKHECSECHRAKKIVQRVADAWHSNYPDSNYLYIAEVDILDRTNIPVFDFLQLREIPHIWLIPPTHISQTHNSSREIKYDEDGEEVFANFDIFLEPHAEFDIPEASFDDQTFQFADWLAISMQKRIILNQSNPVAKFVATFSATFGAIVLIKKKGPSAITSTISKAKVYRALVLFALLALLGGYSFTTIQQTPFIAYNEKGPIYISGGVHYQFGVEIVLVAGIYFLLGAAVMILFYLGRYKVTLESLINTENVLALLQVLTVVVIYFFYSVLTSMFLRKDHGYPYGLMKLF